MKNISQNVFPLLEENALDPPDFIYLKMQFLQQLLQIYRSSEEKNG